MKLLEKLKILRHKLYICKYCHEKIKNNKIILWANSFKHFGCSPKYIALYLLKKYPRKFDLVWVFENGRDIPSDLPREIRVVRYFSLEYLREIHTAKFIICNMRTGEAHFWHKRPEQIYIQTWHSSLRLKKIEGDAINLPQQYVKNAQLDSEKIDLLLSGCDFSTQIFRRAFWYNGEIGKFGTPRCDILVNPDEGIKRKVYDIYKIDYDKKLVLYAPTFRKDNKPNILNMDFKCLEKCLNNQNNGEWVVGCRLHPNITQYFSNSACVPMSNYSDMQELISASELLITDYSSCMFDMAIANKPCILYVPDLEDYILNERELYFKISDLPFPIAKNMKELVYIIDNFNVSQYKDKVKAFLVKVGSYEDGGATERVVKYIVERLNG